MALKGNIPVIPTPFLNGEIQYDDFDRLFERTLEHVDGYVVAGSTGEAPSLTSTERKSIIRYFKGKIPKGKEIVIGLGHTSLADAIEIGLTAAESGITAALVPSPYYFPNSLDMVIDYIGKLGENTGLDIIFYDNPTTTKTRYTTEQLITIAAAVPQLKAVKMTDHAFDKIRALKSKTKLSVFGGDDIICFRAFEAGVDGNMIIAPIIFPEVFKDCWTAYKEGRIEESFNLYSQVLLPFINMFGPGDEICTTKALFKYTGIFSSSETRSPLLPADEQRTKEVILAYKQAEKFGIRHAYL